MGTVMYSFKIVPTLLFEPALAAKLAYQKACTPGDITQFFLINIFTFKCRIRQLLFQSTAKHGIKRVIAYFQVFPVRCIQHIQRVNV